MKKFLAGCLIVALIGLAGLGVALYFGYRAARPLFDSAGDYVSRAREMAALGERISNKAPFAAPDSGELTRDQVDRFVRAHERVQKTLGTRWAELEGTANELQKKADLGRRELSVGEVVGMFSQFSDLFVEARRAQVDALNAEQFSPDEYNWVRLRVYEAAGLELAGGLDLSAIEEMIRQGRARTGVDAPAVPLPNVPERNRALVKPHTAKLKESWGLAFLGM